MSLGASLRYPPSGSVGLAEITISGSENSLQGLRFDQTAHTHPKFGYPPSLGLSAMECVCVCVFVLIRLVLTGRRRTS